MAKEVKALECEVCARVFSNEEDAKHENHKVVKTRGDPIVRLY